MNFYKKTATKRLLFLLKSGWQDSNLRPPAPKAGAMTGLRYIPLSWIGIAKVAIILSYPKDS